ncbi:MAG: sensor histidine kinase [Gaiellales bacterium]
MLRRLSLRARLTMLTVVLVAAGLVAAGIATRAQLRTFLLEKIDQQLQSQIQPPPNVDQDTAMHAVATLPRGSYAYFLAPSGRVFGNVWESGFVNQSGRPEPSTRPPTLFRSPRPGLSTVGGYRVYAYQFSAQPNNPFSVPPTYTEVGAIPLSDMNSTLNKLTALELLVGAIVLAIVGGLAYALVRVELRPLQRIEDTAAAIAAGDLSQRVPEAPPSTEVGRLGASLNAMLAQIERAFKEREASEDRLRRFVADASHELKTPLTSVRGYAELFRRGAAERPEDLALVLGRIEAEAERMGVLVDDLLLLARLDQGRPLERKRFDLTATVAELVDDHRLLHPRWPIELHDPEPVTMTGDPLRLRQAIGNLISNARAHTPPGTPVSVSVRTDGGNAVVDVADRGPGVPPEDADRVFERFFRADPSRARASGGSGLGLSIVAAIAEAHGGRAELADTSEHGSTFRIVVPTGVADEQPEPESPPVLHTDTEPLPQQTGEFPY